MRILGFQKMTMLDYPGKVAATVFTPGCDLRCPFCHNASLVTHIPAEESIAPGEILEYLKKRRGLLDGLAVTGGEPLLQPGLEDFLREVKALGFPVKLDSNGFHPQGLKRLTEQHLVDYVAVDIKNSPAKYALTAGKAELDIAPLKESIALLMGGGTDYEFRSTLVGELHSLDDIEEMGRLIAGAKRWFLQSFVDSGDLIAPGFHAPEPEFLLAAAEKAREFVENVEIRGVDF